MVDNAKEIDEAVQVIDRIMPILGEAERNMSSARNWGIIDLLGGGLFVDLIKHSKINRASNSMSQVSVLLEQLQKELRDIQLPSDYKMNTGTIATFADFFWDGALADAWMEFKIHTSLQTIRDLQGRLQNLRENLIKARRSLPN